MKVTLSQELKLNNFGNIVKIGAIVFLFCIVYYPAFVDLNAKFSEIDSYYSHGYLIPFISIFFIWCKRKELKDMVVLPSLAGLGVFGGGLLLYLFASWWFVNFLADASMIIVLGGISLYLFGKKITRELLFPLGFLFFMIPLPKIAIIYITFRLKLFAAVAAAKVISIIGIPAVVKGAFIILPNNTLLEVGNACSGLRSLIALLALGVAYAYFLRVSPLKKCIFLLSILPIAIGANLTRIVINTLIFYTYRPPSHIFKRIDTINGLLVFVFAFIGLYIVGKVVVLWEEYKTNISM